MISTVILNWKKTKFKDLEFREDSYFYALTLGSNLLYIGISFRQNVQNEIKNTIKSFDLNTQGLTPWLGYILESDFGKNTEKIIKDIECLLIFTNQPSFNIQCKANYTGRDNLEIINRRCPYLRRRVWVTDGQIFYRS